MVQTTNTRRHATKSAPMSKSTPHSKEAPLDEALIERYRKVIEIKAFPYSGKGRTVAFISATFMGGYAARDLTLVEGSRGLFISMPSKVKMKDGKPGINEETGKEEYIDTFFPITAEARIALERSAIDKYTEELNRAPQGRKPTTPAVDDLPF